MPTGNRLYCVLLLHLFLILDSVEAKGQTTSSLRSQIQRERKHQQYESHFLSKKFRALTGNTKVLRFDDASAVKEAVNDVTSHLLLWQTNHGDKDDEMALPDEDEAPPYPRRRLSMVLAVAKASPSAISRRGFALSASMQHLQVAFKTLGDVLSRGGQKVKKGIVGTVKAIGQVVQSALSFLLRQYRRLIESIALGCLGVLQTISSGLKSIGVKTKLLKGSPADTPAAKTPTVSPTTTVSTPPVMSRISSSSSSSSTTTTSTTSSAHFPTWLSSSSTSSAPVATKATPSKKKSQALSSVSFSSLMSSFKKDESKSLEVVAEQSFLAGMFSSLMGGLFVLSTGALVGYLWSDWRDQRSEATMRDDDFIETIDIDDYVPVRQLRSRAVPITPDMSKY